MDDSQAIRRLKDGDIGGLEALVARYQQKAVQTAYLITHDEQLAEDVAQETFVRVYQRIRHYDELRPFGPYLLRSVANAALNAAEKSARWVQFGAGTDVQQVAELLVEAVTVEEQAEYDRVKQEIALALAALPPRQRAAIVQRYFLGMSEKEMAESLSAAPGTVKWLLSAARRRLRGLLDPERSIE
jgi:RNA polymerase sigma-70 factor (ECF subfamily)